MMLSFLIYIVEVVVYIILKASFMMAKIINIALLQSCVCCIPHCSWKSISKTVLRAE